MTDCIFCKLANGEIPTDVVYENDLVTAFKDADPQAPLHVLVVPKRHIVDFNELTENDSDLLLAMTEAIQEVVKANGVQDGYRLVNNIGELGGQSVMHLHIHVLAGRQMQWPPG